MESNFATINTANSKKGFIIIVKVRTIHEHFRLKMEEYLTTASMKSILLLLIKKSVALCKYTYFDKWNTLDYH